MIKYSDLKKEVQRRKELLKDFYGEDRTPMRIFPENKKNQIPESYIELLSLGYIKWSNTTIVTLNGGKYCSLFPSRRGDILAKTLSSLEKL